MARACWRSRICRRAFDRRGPGSRIGSSSGRFENAVAGISGNRARRFEKFKSDAESSEILTIAPPEGLEGLRPMIVVLHGYGRRPAPNAEVYRRVAAELGAIIAAQAAIRPGFRGQGYSWQFRDESEWWVLRAIEKVSARFDVDSEGLILAGFSQGANVALSVGFKHPERFAGALAVAGHYEAHRAGSNRFQRKSLFAFRATGARLPRLSAGPKRACARAA